MLREVKPRNARTARIVKGREPQLVEGRKKVLILHGTKCPPALNSVLKTFHSVIKPDSILFNKKNENIRPFEDPASLEFLASKNDCGLVVFGTHSKKRPMNITLGRVFDGKMLDMVELLLSVPDESAQPHQTFQIGVEMKPMILFAGSQWEDSSASPQSAMYQTLKSMFLDLFQGEEISSVDVAGLQYLLMIAAGEVPDTMNDDPSNKPTVHLRWYKVRTLRSDTPRIPRVEVDPTGPQFDFRIGRHQDADPSAMKEALKHARKPNEARTKKNIETDLVGDKLGRVHLGKQDLTTLQTRKMKGLKRSRDDVEYDRGDVEEMDEGDIGVDSDFENGGMDVDGVDDEDVVSDLGSSEGASGDEISIGEDDSGLEDGGDDEENDKPKRQKLA